MRCFLCQGTACAKALKPEVSVLVHSIKELYFPCLLEPSGARRRWT